MTVPPPSAHGDDGPAVARSLGLDPDDLLDLAMTMNPVAPDPEVVVRRHLGSVRRYPDAREATAALAAVAGFDPERVLLTNGGAEAIALVAAELGGARVDEPEFSLYRRHLARIDPALPRFRSNPGNPGGLLAGPDEVAGAWDEAFYPLATGTWTRGDADRGAWVVGSLTKLLSCPGLRLGYVLAPDAAGAARLAARQPMWSVSGPAVAALPELLSAVDLPNWSLAVRALRADLVSVLGRHGLHPRPSDANYVVVDAPGLRDRLVPHGVLVRDCASFGMPGWVRIAVPDTTGLERLGAALAASAP